MKTNEYMKILVANMLFLCLVWLLAGPGQLTSNANADYRKDKIITKEILLVDSNGKVRGAFKLDNDETPGLFLTDKNENIKCYLAYHKSQSKLVFREDNIDRLILVHRDDKYPILGMNHADGKPAILMSANSKRHSFISFLSGENKSKMLLGISVGQPRMGIFDSNDRFRVMFGMNPDNSSVLAFLDEKSYPALAMGHLLGTPMFRLQRPDKTGIFASYAPDNNVILSMQKEGRFTWSVPEIPRGGRAGDDPLNGIDWDNMIKGWSK